MTTYPIEQFVTVPRLTLGRRSIALERMATHAANLPAAAPILPALHEALAAHRHALAVADRWRSAEGDRAMHAEGARLLDVRLDRAVSGFHAALDGMVKTFEDPEGGLARDLLDEAFPEGVFQLVNLPYVDQHAALGAMTRRLRQSFADAVATLGLEPWIRRIEQLNEEYGQVLTRPERLTWDEVRSADSASYAATIVVVARIVGLYPTNEPADRAGRQALLQPLVDQQQELSRLKGRRKAEGTSGGELLGEETLVEEPVPEETLPGEEPLPDQPSVGVPSSGPQGSEAPPPGAPFLV